MVLSIHTRLKYEVRKRAGFPEVRLCATNLFTLQQRVLPGEGQALYTILPLVCFGWAALSEKMT